MKRVTKYIIILILLLTIVGCKQDNLTEKNRKYYEVNSYLDKKNGWVYYITLVYDQHYDLKYYNFNGINKKVDKIDNLYMPVYENDKEIEQWEPICICLNYYQTYKKEFDEINDFFNEKKFKTAISKEDLSELKLEYYSKNDLVYLFNKALELEYKRPQGKFETPLNSLALEEEDGTWTIVTEGSDQYIEVVFIDYKYKNNKYLSDLVETNSTLRKQYEKIQEIEKYIIEKQDTKNIRKILTLEEQEDYRGLLELIDKIK